MSIFINFRIGNFNLNMKLKLPILILSCFLFSTLEIYSQNCDYNFSGVVIDLHDQSPLSNATILIEGTDNIAISDNNGYFKFSGLCPSNYSVTVSHLKCKSKTFSIKLDGNLQKNLKLEHHINELNEVIVLAESDKRSKTIFENKISNELINDNSSSVLGDVLKNVSGVSSINSGNSIVKPIINGLYGSRVEILNNEVNIQDQQWGIEHAPSIDINSAENIYVIKGAGALQYSGSAIGGIIIAEPSKTLLKDSLYGKTLVFGGSNGKGGSIMSKLTRTYQSGWFSTIQGTFKRFGDFNAPDYVMSNTGFIDKSASFQIGLNQYNYGFELFLSSVNNEIGILRASHLHTAGDQVRAINSDSILYVDEFTYKIAHPNQKVTHNLAKLKVYKRFQDFGKVTFQYHFQNNKRLEFDIRRGINKNTSSTDLRLKTHTLTLDFDSNLFEKFDFKYGIKGEFQNNFPNPETGVKRIIPDYDKYDFGTYFISNIKLNKNWLLEGGVRYDYSKIDALKYYRKTFWESRNYNNIYSNIVINELTNQVLTNPVRNFNNFSATIGLSKKINNFNRVLLNYSIGSRAPNPSELFSEGLHHSSARIELGDLSFSAEKSHKIGLTVSHKKNNINININPYINSINDFIYINPTEIQQTVRGSFQVWEYMQTNARIWGIDTDINYDFTEKFTLKSQISYLKGIDTTNDKPLINMPPLNFKNEISYRNLKFHNFLLSIQSDFTFKQNDFPNNNFEVFVPTTGKMELVDVSSTPSAYHLLNLRSSVEFKKENNIKIKVGLSINNLLNISYKNYLNRMRNYSHDLGRNIILNLNLIY